MKIKANFVALSLMSVLSFGAFAADSINATQAENRQSIGVITANGISGVPSDISLALSKRADQRGAKAYKIIEDREDNNWHATALIYQ